MSSILVIDDHDTIRDGIAQTLMRQGHSVATAKSGEDGLAAFAKGVFDCAITDLRMGGMDGLAVIRELKKRDPTLVIILMTAFGTSDNVEQALEEGAFFFIEKPVKPEILKAVVKAGLTLAKRFKETAVLQARHEALESDLARQRDTSAILGESEPMQRLKAAIARVAPSDATVLIHGESGTGKELVARAVHEQGPRATGPFVAVHCAALAETLLESELFGHEKGSFTGAIRRKLGRFELAEGGTLFLDEVGEIPMSMQSKLLRVLQQKEIQRVGGEETVKVNVRLVSATHRDLKAEVKKGAFREDLYYRLHIVPLELPPLRERPSDINLLARHFAEKHGHRVGRSSPPQLSAEAVAALQHYPWPGNVRELENAIEQALVFTEGDTIGTEQLPPFLQRTASGPSSTPLAAPGSSSLPAGDGPIDLNGILDELERQLVIRAFEAAKGVKTETARMLSLKPSALYYKLEKIDKYRVEKGEPPLTGGP